MADREAGTAVPSRNGSQEAYELLQAAIVDGKLQPNERLVESDLIRMLPASRSAVRTALVRLTQEGLVEHEPNRGAKVRLIDEHEAAEILESRMVLEGLAATRRRPPRDEGDVTELRAILEEMRGLLDHGDLLGASGLNARLHARLLEIAQHGTVSRLVAALSCSSSGSSTGRSSCPEARSSPTWSTARSWRPSPTVTGTPRSRPSGPISAMSSRRCASSARRRRRSSSRRPIQEDRANERDDHRKSRCKRRQVTDVAARDLAHLSHVELLTPRPEESLFYFQEILGMEVSGESGDSVYLRGFGDYERSSREADSVRAGGGRRTSPTEPRAPKPSSAGSQRWTRPGSRASGSR